MQQRDQGASQTRSSMRLYDRSKNDALGHLCNFASLVFIFYAATQLVILLSCICEFLLLLLFFFKRKTSQQQARWKL